jgi:MFS family permease
VLFSRKVFTKVETFVHQSDLLLEKDAGFNYRTRAFIVLWFVNFTLNFAVSLIGTPVPYLIRGFVTGNVEAATTEVYGLMLSVGYVAVALGYFFGGFAADSADRRIVVACSFIILAIGLGLFAAASSLYFLFVAAFVQQFGAGIAAPAISALVADYSARSSRGMAYGVYNLSWITAQIPAPLLGGVLAQFVDLRTPFIVALLISTVGISLAVLMQGRQSDKKNSLQAKDSTVDGSDSNRVMSYRRTILFFSLTNLLNGLLNGFISPLFNSLLLFRLNVDPTVYGLVFSVAFGVVTAVVQVPGGKLTDRFGRKPLVLLGFFSVPLFVALGFSQSVLQFALIVGGICAVGNISSPAISAWIMDLVPKQKRGSVSGITRTLNGIGLAVGPTAGSYAWNVAKPNTALPFGISALIFASGLPLYLALKETSGVH